MTQRTQVCLKTIELKTYKQFYLRHYERRYHILDGHSLQDLEDLHPKDFLHLMRIEYDP